MAKDILKEAIADAKAVREVALANAKAALEEAFTPKLQSMLSAKLSEDLDEDDMDEDLYEKQDDDMLEDGDYNLDEYGLDEEDDTDEGMNYMDEDDMDEEVDMDELMTYDEGEKDSYDEEIDLEEILNELELEEEEDLDEKHSDDHEEMEEAVGYPNYRADQITKVHQSATDINQGLNESEEFDLDSLLKEINDLEEEEEKEKSEGKKDDVDEKHSGDHQINESLFAALGGLAGVLGAAGVVTAVEMALEDPAIKEKYPKLVKVFEFLQKIGGALGSGIKEGDFNLDETKDDKDKELEETKAALEAVKSELNEVNLLNSKLLYVNRIFKANQLDESQKLRVVETLDKAESINEAKLIYETIKDTFNVANTKKVSARKNQTRTIKENFGMASKAAGTSTAPKKAIISESNDMVSRFQKLANITINE